MNENGNGNSGFGGSGRPAWIEIDLGRMRRNVATMRGWGGPGFRWLAVVKAQAYGHGAVRVAQVAIETGASMLGVATVDEAVELRAAGVNSPILLLGERAPEEFDACLAAACTLTVGDRANAVELNRRALSLGRRVPVHVKVDTGMGRFGIAWTDAAANLRELASLPGLQLEGIYSHPAGAGGALADYGREQLARFGSVLRDWEPRSEVRPVRHFCNSEGFVNLPEGRFDLIRTGLLPLGIKPAGTVDCPGTIEPVMRVKARVAVLRPLAGGDSYGYGRSYRAPVARTIAVLPLGYADGYPRLQNQGAVLIRGRRAPLVGTVTMDALAVDVTEVPGVVVGDEAVLLGDQGNERIRPEELATWAGTVVHEVMSGWRSRLPRRYFDEQTWA